MRFSDLTVRFISNSLPGPPSPSQPIRLANVLHNLTGTLSDCIYQSLTGMTQENGALTGARGPQRKGSSGPATGNLLSSYLREQSRFNSTVCSVGRTLL